MYSLHIFIVPALILIMIAVHLFLVVVHKHTQFPGPGRTERNVVGYPVGPVYAAKAKRILLHRCRNSGPDCWNLPDQRSVELRALRPSPVQAGAQPDWYIGFLEGALRMMPGYIGEMSLEFVLPTPWGGNAIATPILLPMGIIGIMFAGMFAWPWIEAWITGDKREHHLLDRPRNAPTRTAVGVATVFFYGLMWEWGQTT